MIVLTEESGRWHWEVHDDNSVLHGWRDTLREAVCAVEKHLALCADADGSADNVSREDLS